MQPFDCITAVAAPIAADNLDTDQIFPARFIARDRKQGGYGRYFLHDHRFDQDGDARPDFVLNDPCFAGARILVAGVNYGSGSGRPGAIFSHLDYGIRVVIAESFGPVFLASAYKSGLLTIELAKADTAGLHRQLAERPGAAVTVDLDAQRVIAPDGTSFTFAIDPFVKRMLREGRDEIEITLGMRDAIDAFEAQHRGRMPWMIRGA